MTTSIDDRVIEAILGPELTRKLDDYIAQEALRDLQRPRLSRLETVKGSVGAVMNLAAVLLPSIKGSGRLASIR
jgi:hypothetical protein